MIRTLRTMALLVSLVNAAFAQESPVSRAHISQEIPSDPAADDPAAQLGKREQYVIEMKILEGKGLISDDGRVIEERLDIRRILRARPTRIAPVNDAAGPPLKPDNSIPPQANEPKGLEAATKANPSSTHLEQTLDTFDFVSSRLGVSVLAQPRVVLVSNQPGSVQIGAQQSFSYLAPLEKGKFEAKRTAPLELGLSITLTLEPVVEDDRFVNVSTLEVQVTALDGREPVSGLDDLEVGEPIISKRSLKTAAKMRLGDTRFIPLPSGPKTQALLLLRVNRVASGRNGVHVLGLESSRPYVVPVERTGNPLQ